MEFLTLCGPLWIAFSIILYIIHSAPQLFLKLSVFTGWILFFGAPILSAIFSDVFLELYRLRGLEVPLIIIFIVSGFALISTSKLYIWVSEFHKYDDV